MKTISRGGSIIPFLACFSAIFLLMHTAMYADAFDTGQIAQETDKLRAFLFGPGTKIVAIFGGAWGIFQSIITGSIKPLLIYGGIGLAANFLPKFIDMVF
ncbi:MAG: hypothetical protein K1000chlam3_00459 [Chlamydiae bacterium]|nr:hypothetical protein [Chlamydiota bacterium]